MFGKLFVFLGKIEFGDAADEYKITANVRTHLNLQKIGHVPVGDIVFAFE